MFLGQGDFRRSAEPASTLLSWFVEKPSQAVKESLIPTPEEQRSIWTIPVTTVHHWDST